MPQFDAVAESCPAVGASDVLSIQQTLNISRGSSWLLPSSLPLFPQITSTATRVKTRRGVLSYSVDRAWPLRRRHPNALVLEFGVFRGGDITFLAKTVSKKSGANKSGATKSDQSGVIHGFDSFEGLPEQWDTPGLTTASGAIAYPAGAFNLDGIPPPVPTTVTLHKGWFSATLPAFLSTHPQPIAFVHADADLYSSTLAFLRPLCAHGRIVVGTVINFDEYWNYPGFEMHEYKAWQEIVAEFGLSFEYICFHGPSTLAPNLPRYNAENAGPADAETHTKAEAHAASDDGQFLSVSVIVTRIRKPAA